MLIAAVRRLHAAAVDSKHRDVVDACKARAVCCCCYDTLSFFLLALLALQFTTPCLPKATAACLHRRWVDDCHAVVICSDPKAARQLLEAATSPSAAPTDFQLRGYADAGSGTRKLPPSGAPAQPVALFRQADPVLVWPTHAAAHGTAALMRAGREGVVCV